MDQKDFYKLSHCAIGNLRKASRATSIYGDAMLQSSGLRVTQFLLLGAVAEQGRISVSQLGDKLLMDQTTVTRNLKLLKEMELVDSVRGEDGRTRLVSVTEQGNRKLDEIMPLWEQAQSWLVDKMGHDHFDKLLEELGRVAALVR